ncbi:YggS family pyridoxal phosphate-dependent enzyme [Adhaeretor mobilis]|uniref:Pyridoxal phosphate homeostasis protein n=1 Tax=Adhaeretor mobilis TaxID=1930276 RepID=A0A517MVX5_9BACT|nr:YggS family pyridoxal phosphate-dependent enzyme [Adhaeretor mobilis]QDS99033.1 Pyridoxal phosphate homeostasis protein [Adhaeretor mobilis]
MEEATGQLIADNWRRIVERVAAAVQSAGRDPNEVSIVAVTKYVGVPESAALLAAGATLLGESRPQQLWEKCEAEQLTDARWHLIGHLQRNKVARTVECAELIHSVDSPRLLKAINSAAEQTGKNCHVLLEVNTSGEAEKHGLTPDALSSLLDQLNDYPQAEVRGLMTMASRSGGQSQARKNFAVLRELRDSLASEELPLSELSMGMTGDFEAGIAEGATLVRIGSALFEGLEL